MGLPDAYADSTAESKMSKSLIGVANLCMARFASLYSQYFESARMIFGQSTIKPTIDKWNISSERFDEIYRLS